MKFLVAALAALALPSAAFAQARVDTTRMSCAAAQTLVARAGAIVLGTGGQTYDRFVVHRGYCTPSEVTEPGFVPAGDTPACMVGYLCIENRNDRDP